MTFADLASDFALEAQKNMREASFSNMRYNLENYVLSAFGEMPLEKISEENIISGMEGIKGVKGKISDSTLRKNFVLVKQIARFGIKKGLITPFLLDFEMTSSKHTEKLTSQENSKNSGEETLSEEEIQSIIKASYTNPLPSNIGFLLSLCLGLKIGEICALRWSDILLDEGLVKVERTLQRVEGGKGASFVIEQPLGHGKSQRILPLPDKMLVLIRENFGERFDENSLGKSNFVITDSSSHSEPRVYRRIFSRFLKDAGIKQVKFSALQKFYESRKNFSLKQVEKTVSLEIL